MVRCFLGIDPGLGGGLALLHVMKDPTIATPMPKTDHDLAEWFRSDVLRNDECLIKDIARPTVFALIERVHALPKSGSSSAFKLGQSYGALRALLAAFEIPYTEVTPGVWKRHFGLLAPGTTDTQKKNASKAKAQQLFPNLKITHAIADALLIAEYGRARGIQENR